MEVNPESCKRPGGSSGKGFGPRRRFHNQGSLYITHLSGRGINDNTKYCTASEHVKHSRRKEWKKKLIWNQKGGSRSNKWSWWCIRKARATFSCWAHLLGLVEIWVFGDLEIWRFACFLVSSRRQQPSNSTLDGLCCAALCCAVWTSYFCRDGIGRLGVKSRGIQVAEMRLRDQGVWRLVRLCPPLLGVTTWGTDCTVDTTPFGRFEECFVKAEVADVSEWFCLCRKGVLKRSCGRSGCEIWPRGMMRLGIIYCMALSV